MFFPRDVTAPPPLPRPTTILPWRGPPRRPPTSQHSPPTPHHSYRWFSQGGAKAPRAAATTAAPRNLGSPPTFAFSFSSPIFGSSGVNDHRRRVLLKITEDGDTADCLGLARRRQQKMELVPGGGHARRAPAEVLVERSATSPCFSVES